VANKFFKHIVVNCSINITAEQINMLTETIKQKCSILYCGDKNTDTTCGITQDFEYTMINDSPEYLITELLIMLIDTPYGRILGNINSNTMEVKSEEVWTNQFILSLKV